MDPDSLNCPNPKNTDKGPTKNCNKDYEDRLASRINIDRYSDFGKLIRVTARILAMYQRKPKSSFKHAGQRKKACIKTLKKEDTNACAPNRIQMEYT